MGPYFQDAQEKKIYAYIWRPVIKDKGTTRDPPYGHKKWMYSFFFLLFLVKNIYCHILNINKKTFNSIDIVFFFHKIIHYPKLKDLT